MDGVVTLWSRSCPILTCGRPLSVPDGAPDRFPTRCGAGHRFDVKLLAKVKERKKLVRVWVKMEKKEVTP